MKGNAALNALWDALADDLKPPPPKSITVFDYSDKFGITRATAFQRLECDVKRGKLDSGLFNVPGHKGKCRCYWLAESKK